MYVTTLFKQAKVNVSQSLPFPKEQQC